MFKQTAGQLRQIGTGQSSTFLQSTLKALRGLANPKIGLPLLAVTAGLWYWNRSRHESRRREALGREIEDLELLRGNIQHDPDASVASPAVLVGPLNTDDLSRTD